jgi:hypothetical protein
LAPRELDETLDALEENIISDPIFDEDEIF